MLCGPSAPFLFLDHPLKHQGGQQVSHSFPDGALQEAAAASRAAAAGLPERVDPFSGVRQTHVRRLQISYFTGSVSCSGSVLQLRHKLEQSYKYPIGIHVYNIHICTLNNVRPVAKQRFDLLYKPHSLFLTRFLWSEPFFYRKCLYSIDWGALWQFLSPLVLQLGFIFIS